MDTVKVVLVVGTITLLAFVHDARASTQSSLQRSPELLCQNKPVERGRNGGASRDLSPASSVEKTENQTVQQNSDGTESLRAFESAGRMEGQNVGLFIGVLIFGVVGAIIIFFVMYALLYEPSEISRPYRPTEVKRSENFVPYQHSRSRNEHDQ